MRKIIRRREALVRNLDRPDKFTYVYQSCGY
uniref:Uncharacterized protein n=1 Tax=Arundo donax TaxID=35708 RepID=A0A0A8ZA12_ARUDO